jgi:hypothetical protein
MTSSIVGDEWSASRPGRFNHWERGPGIQCIEGLMDPRADLDDIEKWKFFTLLGLELRSFGRPAYSQSLCRVG